MKRDRAITGLAFSPPRRLYIQLLKWLSLSSNWLCLVIFLLRLAKYSDLGRRARHAVPLQSEHGSCQHNSRDSVSQTPPQAKKAIGRARARAGPASMRRLAIVKRGSGSNFS